VFEIFLWLLGEEAVASPSIGNTLWCVSMTFTRLTITPPDVNRFRWNLRYSEYIVWSWPRQILGAIHTEARAGERAEIFFCPVNNARLCPARVVWWLEHLGAMCSRAWRAQCAIGSRFNSSHGPVRRVRLRKSNYVKIIPTHMMIREIIPGRQQRVWQCPL